MDRDKIGEPLGTPGKRGEGDAQPPGAGSEGGLGSWGDQRQDERHEGREQVRKEEPPLDGTVKKEHIEGDTDEKAPGAQAMADPIRREHRFDMELRKRQPLIIW